MGGRARRFSVSGQEEMEGQVSHPSPRPALDCTGPPDAAPKQGKPRPTSSQDLVREGSTGNCCHLTAGSSVTDGFPCWWVLQRL